MYLEILICIFRQWSNSLQAVLKNKHTTEEIRLGISAFIRCFWKSRKVANSKITPSQPPLHGQHKITKGRLAYLGQGSFVNLRSENPQSPLFAHLLLPLFCSESRLHPR